MQTASTPESEFVLRLLQRAGGADLSNTRLEAIADAGPDWNVILNLVSQHRLSSVLRGTLNDLAIDPPQEVTRTLDARYREYSIGNLSHSRQLYELSDLFESNAIAALPYKGPVLAEAAYGGIGDRAFGDLDFLVAKDDVKTACDILERHGYERINFSDVPVETLVDGTVFRWGKEFRFVDRDGGLPVELRFGFIGGNRSDSAVFADLWDRRMPTALAGRTVSALSPEDRALLLLVHGTKHGWRQLLWVYDIALILGQDIDWKAVLTRADTHNWRNAVLYGLAVTAELTGLSIPETVQTELDSSRLCSWGARQTVGRLQEGLDENLLYLEPITTSVFLNDNLYSAFLEGADEILAPRKADHDWITLPTHLHPLYRLVRPCRLGVSTIKQIVD